MDEKLADPHVGLALIHTFFDWDFDAAQKEFSRALELNSGSAEIHHLYSYYLTAVGNIDQAIVELEHAVSSTRFPSRSPLIWVKLTARLADLMMLKFN